MNKKDQDRILATAKEIERLRKTIESVDRLKRFISRRKSIIREMESVRISIDVSKKTGNWRRDHIWETIPGLNVLRDFAPIIKAMGDSARERLAELE